ncbi:MAG: 50S ribosomal protein L18, partial [Opitutae bacterium]
MKLSKKKALAQKRRWRIRKKINGSAERPRVAVCFTNKNIHAQCVDDVLGHTVVGVA